MAVTTSTPSIEHTPVAGQVSAGRDAWSALRSPFMDRLTGAERTRIFETSARVAAALDAWAAPFSLIRRVRAKPLALSVTAAAPSSSDEALISTARLSLWVFTIDDVFDEELFPESEVLDRAEL